MTNIEKTIDALRANGIDVCRVATADEVLAAVQARIPSEACVAKGGSVSLEQTGVTAWLRSGAVNFIDRDAADIAPEEKERRMRRSYGADVYLCSANAITETGELYQVDGLGNRVSAMVFGPARVIVVAGVNKIVPTLSDAIRRVKTVAAPLNTRRLSCDTPCAKTGRCITVGTPRETEMTAGCRSKARICCEYLVTGQQRVPHRICVILCDEALGY